MKDRKPSLQVISKKLKTALAKKRQGKLHRQILFHLDNTPVHTAKTVTTILQEFRWEILSHPPYSPDLAPYDFFLFPKLKKHLKGTRSQSINKAKREVVIWLTRPAAEFYQEGISRWKHRLQKCIELGGSSVEK